MAAVRQLGLATFVAVDVETTGVDPAEDQIIQLGAVRLEGGRVAGRFVALVDPGRPVPFAVERLTGISTDMLRGMPPIKEALPAFRDFVGEGPVVAHNAPFDTAFLDRALGDDAFPLLPRPIYDTLDLARIVLPTLGSHRLETLAPLLDILVARHHDASADAEAAGLLFARLLEDLLAFDHAALEHAALFLGGPAGGASPLGTLLARAREQVAREQVARGGSGGRKALQAGAGADAGAGAAAVPEGAGSRQRPAWDAAALASWLSPHGPLAGVLPGYEPRPSQEAMLGAVGRAFEEGGALLAEAGTGTGKSLAYLIPAAAWAAASGRRVVVSTHTLQLQEQLWQKDIPFLARHLPFPFRAALAKGRGHYLCRLKWEGVVADAAQGRVPGGGGVFYARLATWLADTATGDRAEVNVRWDEEPFWAAVGVDDGCAGERCRHRDACYYLDARRRAAAADVVVTNHALLLADAAADNGVLPPYQYLVCDEAHHLPELAGEHLGVAVVEGDLRQQLLELTRPGVGEGRPGLLTRVERVLRVQGGATGSIFEGDGESAAPRLAAAQQAAARAAQGVEELFLALRAWAQEGPQRPGDHPVKTWRLPAPEVDRPAWQGVRQKGENAAFRLQDAGRALLALAQGLADNPAGGWPPELLAEMEARGHALGTAGQALGEVLALSSNAAEQGDGGPDPWQAAGRVAWFEWEQNEGRERRPGPGACRLRLSPLFPGPLLSARLVNRLDAAVFTSATLSIGGRFDHAAEQLGLAGREVPPVFLQVPSPFDYANQALLCLASDLPDPKLGEEAHTRAVADFLVRLCRSTGGRTLVLFTANRSLRRVYQEARPALEAMGILPLAQGLDGGRGRLTEAFRANPRSVLFGAASFWEGVDIPGDALSCVVVVRLPFRPPGTPLAEAREEALSRRGEDPFRRLSVPDAVLRFKQGFGRLIRSAADRGAVVVLDPRLLQRRSSYGQAFLDSLPGPRLFVGSQGEVVEAVDNWLHGSEPLGVAACESC